MTLRGTTTFLASCSISWSFKGKFQQLFKARACLEVEPLARTAARSEWCWGCEQCPAPALGAQPRAAGLRAPTQDVREKIKLCPCPSSLPFALFFPALWLFDQHGRTLLSDDLSSISSARFPQRHVTQRALGKAREALTSL